MLYRIATDETLGPVLALHGGTAVNTFYFDCPRLSCDIDISYIGEEDYDQMKPVRPRILEKVKDAAQSFGYMAKYGKSEDAGRTVLVTSPEINFKIDVNFMNRVPLLPPQTMKSLFVPGAKAYVLSPYDVFGGKLRAALGRSKVRDLYDLGTIGRNAEKYDERLLHGCLLLYATLSERFPQYQLDGRFSNDISAERFGDLEQAIEVELLPMLFNDPAAPSAKQLLEEARGFVARYVDVRDDRDCEFVNSMENAIFKPELILPEEVARRARRFPEALWKVKNLQKYVELPDPGESVDSQLDRQMQSPAAEHSVTQSRTIAAEHNKNQAEQEEDAPGGDEGSK